MKKVLSATFALVLGLSCFAGCAPDGDKEQEWGDEIVTHGASLRYAFDEFYKNGEVKDGTNGFSTADDVKGGRFFVSGAYQPKFEQADYSRKDVKLELFGEGSTRIVNASGGIVFTIPADEISADYSIAKYTTKYSFGDSVLSVSVESSNTYTGETNPWYTYASDWLFKFINSDKYIEANNLSRIDGSAAYEFTKEHSVGDLSIKEGHDVYRFDVQINDAQGIEHPYYHIAVVREENENAFFTLFVLKSKSDRSEEMNKIVQSYKHINSKGVARNYLDAGKPAQNSKWNPVTKAYFASLNYDYVNWGAFSASMPNIKSEQDPESGAYQNRLALSRSYQKGIEELWDHNFDIYPTYTHLSNTTGPHYFPKAMAKELADGDGRNGRPVLQLSYQFTTDNNNVQNKNFTEYTPLFDIMRGKFDEQFRTLARDIKEYEKPVLFRLNNEMNTDWTSYCALLTLLDPDIFIATWQRLYNIFEEENVNNAIWIWNPFGTTYPYCSWGEDLCYFPGAEYVQLLGGTSYEMNNYKTEAEAAAKARTFDEHYKTLYEKNKGTFSQWNIILAEFACGSGGNATGELGRNRDFQAQWVRDMFAAFNAENKPDWAKPIKGAVWFNADDVSDGRVTNRLRFYAPDSNAYDDLTETWQAFREGFAAAKKK